MVDRVNRKEEERGPQQGRDGLMANFDWKDMDWDWEDAEDSSSETEEQKPEIDKEWLDGILREFHKEPVSSVETMISSLRLPVGMFARLWYFISGAVEHVACSEYS